MNNNVRHSVGDKVVALSSASDVTVQPRVKDEIYTIHAISYTPCCGRQLINIGYKEVYTHYGCCGAEHPSNGFRWTLSHNFAPLSETSLQHAVEEENYELAAIIRDALKQTEKC